MTTIELASGNNRWKAQIDDTPAARDFIAQLPLELTLKDFAGSEKIANLPRPLKREGSPSAITPKAGDIAFYAPWGNLAIFYRDGHHSPGLISLGQIDGDIAALAGGQSIKLVIKQVRLEGSLAK